MSRTRVHHTWFTSTRNIVVTEIIYIMTVLSIFAA